MQSVASNIPAKLYKHEKLQIQNHYLQLPISSHLPCALPTIKMPIAASQVVTGADLILGKILNSRLQRKAKSVILSCVEFLAVDYAIFLTYADFEIENQNMKNGLNVSLIAGAIYIAFVALFLFVHSMIFLKVKDMQTNQKIEDAFEKTNRIPFLDGILEAVFPIMFKGHYWYFPYITWLVCIAVVGFNAFVFYSIRDQLTSVVTLTLLAGALLFYQITSDFSEYWVHSRHRESTTTLASTDDTNGDDIEEPITDGNKGTTTTRFSRL